jgi:hypothetical protein
MKHFQLFAGSNGQSNRPPNSEELETNYFATFFQCGTFLENHDYSDQELAKKALSDPLYVSKARGLMRLDVFKREYNLLKRERVIL